MPPPIIAIAAPVQRAGFDLGRQMAFLQRQQPAGMKDDVGIGDAAVGGRRGRRTRQLAAEAAEQRAAGVVLGLPFRRADPAVAIAGAAVFEMEGVQHAVADEPVRAGRLELRIGAVAIERAVEFARQLARDFQKRRVAFKRDRRPVGPRRWPSLAAASRSPISLHRKDIDIGTAPRSSSEIFTVSKLLTYKAPHDEKIRMTPEPAQARRSEAAPTRAAGKGPRRAAGAKPANTPYHHGALRDALLEAAERVLERDGLPGLTLRAVAREAGVSHAAPTHHFGDLTGLSANSPRSVSGNSTPRWRLPAPTGATLPEKAMARAKAYVAYAQAHPGMYGLMFRTERLDMSRPSLHEAAEASFAGLAGCDRRQPPRADFRGSAVAGPGCRHRARLVAGAWFHHAAARWPALRYSAPVARGHRLSKRCWMRCCARRARTAAALRPHMPARA